MVFTAVTSTFNTRPWKDFFSCLKPEFLWISVNCFYGFDSCPLPDKVFTSFSYKNNFEYQRNFQFPLRWIITVNTAWSLQVHEWNGYNTFCSKCKHFQVVYLGCIWLSENRSCGQTAKEKLKVKKDIIQVTQRKEKNPLNRGILQKVNVMWNWNL